MIDRIIKFFRRGEQTRADVDFLLMETEYLEKQNEVTRADCNFYSMILEEGEDGKK